MSGDSKQSLSFEQVFRHELLVVRARRHLLLHDAPEADEQSKKDAVAAITKDREIAEKSKETRQGLADVRQVAHEMNLTGVAFSGGGIRSATFALGVLQALAKVRLLGMVDYLSTVSGGGYIGSWLAAWVKREKSLINVEKQLHPGRKTQSEADRGAPAKDDSKAVVLPLRQVVDEEPEPIHHLRAYSRYLTPKAGAFSMDTWTLIAIYLRNLFINLLVLVPGVLCVILFSRLLIWTFTQSAGDDAESFLSFTQASWQRILASGVYVGALLLALIFLSLQRIWLHEAKAVQREHDRAEVGIPYFRLLVWVLVFLVAPLGVWIFGLDPELTRTLASKKLDSTLRHLCYGPLNQDVFTPWMSTMVKFMIVFAVIEVGVFFLIWAGRTLNGKPRVEWKVLWSDIIRGAFAGLFLTVMSHLVGWRFYNPVDAAGKLIPVTSLDLCILVTLGVPSVLFAMILAGWCEMALVGRWLNEYEREWRSRLAAYLMAHAVGWLVFFGATLFLPYGLELLTSHSQSVLGSLWVAISAAGAYAGRSARTGERSQSPSRVLEFVAVIAPPIFLIGLLAALSMLCSWIVDSAMLAFKYESASPSFIEGVGRSSLDYLDALLCCSIGAVSALALFAYFINVNHFSLHAGYANRLVRCYLGASRRKRDWGQRIAKQSSNGTSEGRWLPGVGGAPTNAERDSLGRGENEVTGFDPQDDFALSELKLDPTKPLEGYRGPYPLINTALNLVSGGELAFQDRKAESFVLTPDYCGSKATGYAKTPEGQDGRHLTLGRGLTISGAAVDPNMGYHQSAPLTALMTIFNTRVGWWMENPYQRGDKWKAKGPAFGGLLVYELLGKTDEKSLFMHLSDGGHFENLGVYELIRRRCRTIVVTDAGTDRRAASDNLANMLRLIRTDFGIGIEMDVSALEANEVGLSRFHCTTGRICYSDVDGGDPSKVNGVLIYLCASLTGDESPDIRQYANGHSSFPHQSTADQFFDAEQFESYRCLGHHVAMEVFHSGGESLAHGYDHLNDPPAAMAHVVHELLRRYPLPLANASASHVDLLPAFAQGNRDYIAVHAALSANKDLLWLNAEIAQQSLSTSHPDTPEIRLAERNMVAQMLALLETSWLALRLDHYGDHPLHTGWTAVCRRWLKSPILKRHWESLKDEFGQDFQRFVGRLM